MRLAPDLWLEGSYYIDFDIHGQLRIIGPNNHLQFATVGIYRDQIRLDSVQLHRGEAVIKGAFKTAQLFMHDPAMGHIRRLRKYIELPGRPVPKLIDVAKKHPGELAPNYIDMLAHDDGFEVGYKRLYQNHWYGIKLKFAANVAVERHEKRRGFELVSEGNEINFTLTTDADEKPVSPLTEVITKPKMDLPALSQSNHKELARLLDRTAVEIKHLVTSNKTSGVEYGTVFPRDWMEAADLGVGDLTPAAVEYMYHKAFEHIDHGQGWHENAVGEFKTEQEQELGTVSQDLDDLIDHASILSRSIKNMVDGLQRLYIDRNMIDIEPHYILGVPQLNLLQLSADDTNRLRDAGQYVVRQARLHDLITFKKIPGVFKRHRNEEYAESGNWRDSSEAFKMVHPVIAPYDVNVVFYPQALRQIAANAEWFGVDEAELKKLIKKWDGVKDWYRFTNTDGRPGYALALYDIQELKPGVKYRRLEVNHIDESYDLFYGQPREADVINFAERLLDPDYFYTPSGPVLVGAHDGYTTADYHGNVIWTKQTAYVVAGLAKQLDRSDFKAVTKELVQKALAATAEASLAAFLKLEAIPELHYDKNGQPHLFNDQPHAMGPMNLVQLWSAVGARRIIRTYLETLHGSVPARAR